MWGVYALKHISLHHGVRYPNGKLNPVACGTTRIEFRRWLQNKGQLGFRSTNPGFSQEASTSYSEDYFLTRLDNSRWLDDPHATLDRDRLRWP